MKLDFFSQINQIDCLIIFTYSFLSLSPSFYSQWTRIHVEQNNSQNTNNGNTTLKKIHPISIFFLPVRTFECAYKINVEEEFIVPESTNLSTKWIRIIRIIQTILFA